MQQHVLDCFESVLMRGDEARFRLYEVRSVLCLFVLSFMAECCCCYIVGFVASNLGHPHLTNICHPLTTENGLSVIGAQYPYTSWITVACCHTFT